MDMQNDKLRNGSTNEPGNFSQLETKLLLRGGVKILVTTEVREGG